jgi:hypothetical protein
MYHTTTCMQIRARSCIRYHQKFAPRHHCSRSQINHKSYDRKKFWPSIKHSKLSGSDACFGLRTPCMELIEFRDWRYSQSCWYFRPSFVNHCSSNLLSGLRPHFSKSKYSIYKQCVAGRRWGGGVLSCVGDHILQV